MVCMQMKMLPVQMVLCWFTKGTLIQKAESNENGKAAFTADIPIGFHYVVKEIQAPPLYVQSSDSYEFFYEYKNDTTYTYTFCTYL